MCKSKAVGIVICSMLMYFWECEYKFVELGTVEVYVKIYGNPNWSTKRTS